MSGGETLLGGGSNSVDDLHTVQHSVFHAISDNGGRVFFSASACLYLDFSTFSLAETPAVRELFVRTGGNAATQRTIPISVPAIDSCRTDNQFVNPVDPVACRDALFEGASVDGSRVYFTTTAPEVPGNVDTTTNLYEAEVGETAVQRMTQVSTGDSSGADVQGVVRVSDDGSHVYFVARGKLTTAAGPGGHEAVQGADNLYVHTVDGATSFIAQIPEAEAALWGQDRVRPAQTTADGRYLVFDTAAELTPDDTDSATDVYLYDSGTGSLSRVSAGHSGYDGDGNNGVYDSVIIPPDFVGQAAAGSGVGSTRLRRVVSNDGRYVFFKTAEALQSSDVNGQADVYEWHDGQVSLLSDGRNPNPEPTAAVGISSATSFVGASITGNDAFFQTTSVLTPAGGDGAYDLYDARIGGGFAAASGAPECVEDACQGQPTAVSVSPTPGGSATTRGGDNISNPAEPARISVLVKAAKGATFSISTKVSDPGLIKVAGALVKTISKKEGGAGTYTLKVTLGAKGRDTLRRRHKLKVKLRVTLSPTSGMAVARNVSLTVKGS
ncbi:MAG TPA: hypothetical protein VLJ42_08225 [Solirubrobacteraceae bacterium]|nr:hypothetical protein [Solirubrobacteraceae bacterium]